MSEHGHNHARNDSLQAAGLSVIAGFVDLAAGKVESSFSLFADLAHQTGDASGYAINGVIGDTEPSRQLRWRKRAATAVCAGAFAIGAASAYNLITDGDETPGLAAPAAAGFSYAVSRAVHKKIDQHKHLGGGHSDNAVHAHWDVRCSQLTLAATSIAALGVPKIDSIGGVIVSGLTIYANWPGRIE